MGGICGEVSEQACTMTEHQCEPNRTRTDGDVKPLSLRLFGSFDLQIQETSVVSCSRPVQALLTLLVLRNDRVVDRAWLSETLWPDAAPDRARFYLRRSLTEL